MKEKFRLRCDLNSITDIENMDQVAIALEEYAQIEPHHRYSYLFRGYHDLAHGKIDDETFFTLGDVSSEHALFTHARSAGLETVFMLTESTADKTLYLVEYSAWSYYVGKVGEEKAHAFRDELQSHGSSLLVI